jgi:hypothetical protein
MQDEIFTSRGRDQFVFVDGRHQSPWGVVVWQRPIPGPAKRTAEAPGQNKAPA